MPTSCASSTARCSQPGTCKQSSPTATVLADCISSVNGPVGNGRGWLKKVLLRTRTNGIALTASATDDSARKNPRRDPGSLIAAPLSPAQPVVTRVQLKSTWGWHILPSGKPSCPRCTGWPSNELGNYCRRRPLLHRWTCVWCPCDASCRSLRPARPGHARDPGSAISRCPRDQLLLRITRGRYGWYENPLLPNANRAWCDAFRAGRDLRRESRDCPG